MDEPVFFKPGEGLTLEEIVVLTGAEPSDPRVRDFIIRNVAAPEFAGHEDLTFADRPTAALSATQAGACFIVAELAPTLPAGTVALLSPDPIRAFVQVANALYPNASRPSSLFEAGGKAGSATIHSTARLEPNVTIDPGAMVGPRAEIGSGTVIGPMTVIGPAVRIGRDCAIGAGSSVTNALIGDHVVIRAGCRLGDSKPLNTRAEGARSAQVGRVIIQDSVQLGANCTIDRGFQTDTVLGEHTCVDNLVRIPADLSIGRHCIISLMPTSHCTDPALLSDFTDTGVIPDHTAIDARAIASVSAR